jgi:hypothetical protein
MLIEQDFKKFDANGVHVFLCMCICMYDMYLRMYVCTEEEKQEQRMLIEQDFKKFDANGVHVFVCMCVCMHVCMYALKRRSRSSAC